jgi:Fe2+ transport system protein FeoA
MRSSAASDVYRDSRYIASLGLRPGVRVTVVDRQPFDDLVTIEVGGMRHVIGRELGHVLQCAPAEEA